MADELSAGELQQLKEIAGALPAGHPALNKVNLLLSSQPTQFEKDREPATGPALLRGAKAVGSDVLNIARGTGEALLKGPTGVAASAPEQAAQMFLADQSRKREGYGPSYRTAAGIGSLAGIDASGMEEAARHGDTAGIVGHTVVPLAGAAVGADEALTGGKGLRSIGGIGGKAVESIPKTPSGRLSPVTRLVLGDRASTLLEMLTKQGEKPAEATPSPFSGMTSTVKPIGKAELPAVPTPKRLEPITRAPSEIYQRPIQAAPGAGKGAAPAEMHPEELAEIRKEAEQPEMTPEEAHRFRVNKMASAAAEEKPANELGGIKRAGEVQSIEPATTGPKKLPTLFQKGTRPEVLKIGDIANQLAGVKPLLPDVPLREQLSPQPTEVGQEVDPIKAKYPDPAVRQMVRANGERMYEAAKGNPGTVKAIHDLTRVELRQALINAGEDMGQMTVSNSKFAGEGSIPREEAFNRLLDRGLKPDQILKLAKGNPPEAAPAEGILPERPPRTSSFGAQRAARERAQRIREARP